jgi:hypothetical protein
LGTHGLYLNLAQIMGVRMADENVVPFGVAVSELGIKFAP